MFSMKAYRASVKARTNTPVKQEKRRYTAAECKQYLIETGQWPADASQPKTERPVNKLSTECPACDGSGEYVGTYSRPCFRCKGKGYMDELDHRRWEARLAAIRSGEQKITYLSYEKTNGANSWGASA